MKKYTLPASLAIHLVAFLGMQWGTFFQLNAPKGRSLQQGDSVVVRFIDSKKSPEKTSQTQPRLNISKNNRDFLVKTKKQKPKPLDLKKPKSQKLGRIEGNAKKAALAGQLGVQDGKSVSLIERYGYELRQYINNSKSYPTFAKRLRIQGQVVVEFEVDRMGKISQPKVKKGSSYPRLDRAAQSLIAALEEFKPFPKELASKSLTFAIPVEYTLE